MPDHAYSTDPAVQNQLDRLWQLSPGKDILGLERITLLLDKLGNPQRDLPPVFHVAGTNGKGSTCAFLRAAIEAAGLSAHVYTSPHLVRFNERIRIAGSLIEDAPLATLLAEVLDKGAEVGASFFEVTTAAAFLAFSRTPADCAIIEVGLGGRLDATNVIERPLVCGIANLGVDHQAFLGENAVIIASEKAGIAKPGAPLVTQKYREELALRVEREARDRGALWIGRGPDWDGAVYRSELHYRDHESKLHLPLPRLPGAHQADNALLAIAMLRHQQRLNVPEGALRAAMGWADWPGRMQKLDAGPLGDILPANTTVWLDGGHNPLAADAIAAHFAESADLHIIAGLLSNKDADGFLGPILSHAKSATFVPITNHEYHAPDSLMAIATAANVPAYRADNIETALRQLTEKHALSDASEVLIAGSLYLIGDVLRENEQLPE